MSEYESRSEANEVKKDDEQPEAVVHMAKWSLWVWLLPALAIFFAGWLVVRYGFFGGGDITVRFSEANGLDRYSAVKFRGAKVGTVQKITIDDKMGQVVVRISMDASMNQALKTGTRFWIVEPGLEGGGVGGLLSGTYVGIAPGDGEDTREFVGQEYAPVLFAPEAGKTVILEGQDLGTIAIGAPVQYHGMRVGRILGSAYDEKRNVSMVHAFVVQRFANRLRQSTRFYRAGGLDISLSGGGLSTGGLNLGSLLNAPIAFYTPDVMAGPEVAQGTRFELYENEATAVASADGPHVDYVTYFPGSLHGLKEGTPVQMRGVNIGHVRDVRLHYVPETASLETPVILEIDPRKLEIGADDDTTREEVRARMNDAMAKLVQKGVRASIGSSIVLPGASAVTLDIVAKPGTGRLVMTNDPPIIPAASGGKGIEDAVASLTEVANKMKALPLEEIASNLKHASERANALVSDPELDQTLKRMNRAMADVEKTAHVASTNVEPIVASLKSAAESAEAAAKRAEQLVGTSQKQNYDVAELIREFTRAAESVRALATYLTENPDALLKGRRK
jgi:paraquat-inducible protein B